MVKYFKKDREWNADSKCKGEMLHINVRERVVRDGKIFAMGREEAIGTIVGWKLCGKA